MKFEYNGRVYNPSNLEKKLKKLGITVDDINIMEEPKPIEEKFEVKLYYFKNNKGYKRCSIYPEIEIGWIPITKEEYVDSLFNN